ncbi:hypothetical protein [Vibrio algicola]|uniref:hypothetical protein n=1 Tax=Vibrio algicola TaxID=2662262 RepID=UPI001CEC5A6D|nr:hypothetical protein [Vibrio algicola]
MLKKQIASRKKARGASSVDILIYATLLIGLIAFVISKVPTINYMFNVSAFQSDVSSISEATYRWKKRRPNYSSVSLETLCQDRYLENSICGDANDGKSTNSFGGDWTVSPNTNSGLYDITATMPNDTDRINELADTMAPTTRGGCSEAEGCATLVKSANSITMTF